MAFFFKDKDQIYDWDRLIDDINKERNYNIYCNLKDSYNIFKAIIISMLQEKEIILLDYDYSESELKKLVNESQFEKYNIALRKSKSINDKSELIERLKETGSEWKITLFTSGTTGMPKKIVHSFNTITRFVKYSIQNKDNIWGFAYNPTHMAGLQVFFQAVLNGNSIVNLFNLSTEEIYNEIAANQITHISATPTFYRILFPLNKVFPQMQRITSGGEKFNEILKDNLSKIFPNAKISNVYASTEAGTLFASNGEIFTINREFEDKVKIYNNELLINKSLLGKSDGEIEEWYKTGDVVEVISKNPLQIKFLSRKNELINVGGYKVNPNEVEEYILTIPGIIGVRVYSKVSSVMGNIICCDIVRENKQLNEPDIRAFLQKKLQEYKIPRIINFTEMITTTRTGKISRL